MLPHPGRFVLPPISSIEQYAFSNDVTATFSNVPYFESNHNYVATPNFPIHQSNTVPFPQQREDHSSTLVCYGIPVETSQEPLKRSSTEITCSDPPLKKIKSEESIDIKAELASQASFANVTNFCISSKPIMKRFSENMAQDFKHVIYNCLVDNYNAPEQFTFVQLYTTNRGGIIRHGFRFNDQLQPEKRLPELYARHIRKARLELQDQTSVFIQDLYKFYLRACIELLSKYFEKINKWTYLYEDIPLFVPNDSLEDAAERIRTMRTRTRKKKAERTQ